MRSEPDDFHSARTEAIEHYLRLLKTNLTESEKEFVQRRIAQERRALQTDLFVVRANIDHYLGLLNGDDVSSENRAVVVKLLVAEEDKLSHDLEQLQFAEDRAANGRDRVSHLRRLCDAAAPDARAQAERLLANVETTQRLLDDHCQRLRTKVNSHL